MFPRRVVFLVVLALAGCGSDTQTLPLDPTELKYSLASPPALRGLLWATGEQWPPPGGGVVEERFDIFALDDRSTVIEAINRISAETWLASRPVLSSDRRLALFTVAMGDRAGLYAYDPASGQSARVVPDLIRDYLFRDDRVLAWIARVRLGAGAPFRKHLFIGSVDGSIPITQVTVDDSFEVLDGRFDLSPSGDWLVWSARRDDGSGEMMAAPIADLSSKVALADFPGEPRFVDEDRIVYEHDGAVMLTRISDPTTSVRLDADPPVGFAPRRGYALVGTRIVYHVENSQFERHLLVASVDHPGTIHRVNPDGVVAAPETPPAWDLSSDDRWLAWVGDSALWLSDLSDPATDAQRLADFGTRDAFSFLPDSSALLRTDGEGVHRVAMTAPLNSTPLAALPGPVRVVSIRSLSDGLHYLMVTSTNTWYSQRLWIGFLDGRPSRLLVPGRPTEYWQEFDFVQLP